MVPKFHAFGNGDTKNKKGQIRRTGFGGDEELGLEMLIWRSKTLRDVQQAVGSI